MTIYCGGCFEAMGETKFWVVQCQATCERCGRLCLGYVIDGPEQERREA